jgi:hypothetical protein
MGDIVQDRIVPEGPADSADSAYAELVKILSRTRRRLAMRALAGGLIRWLCVAGGGLAAALVLAAVLPSSVAGSLTLALGWLSLALSTFLVFLVLPLVRLPRVETLAVRLDSTLAPGANPLITSLQLGGMMRELRGGSEGPWVSLPILKRAVESGSAAARDMDTDTATRDPGMGRWARQLAGVGALSVAMVVLWPGEMGTSVWRLTNPMACGPVPVLLSAGPGDAELDAGADLTVRATVVGTDDAPVLKVRKLGGVWRRVEMRPAGSTAVQIPEGFVGAPTDLLAGESAWSEITPPDTGAVAAGSSGPALAGPGGRGARGDNGGALAGEGAGAANAGSGAGGAASGDDLAALPTADGIRRLPPHHYTFTLTNLQEDQEYNVAVSDRETPTWTVDVNQPPRAVAFRMHYAFPDYTGLPPHESVSASGDVTALKGATVEVEVSANRALAGARLVFGGGDPTARGEGPASGGDRTGAAKTVELTPVSEKSFKGAFRIMNPDRYSIAFVEESGRERSDPRTFSVTPMPDRAPMVRIISPDRAVDLPTEMTIDVASYAADDYGVSSLALIYFMEGGEESRLPVKTYPGAPRELYESYTWDLTELGLLPGEVVFYSVEVLDNDDVSGPKAGRSEVHSVRFPTMAEIYQRTQDEYEEGIDELADQLRRGKELRERLEEISREIKSGQGLSWEQRQRVKGAISDREKMEEAAKEVAESLDEIVDRMGGNGLVDDEVLEKMMEIKKLLSQINDPELRKSIEQLNEALEKVDKEALAKAMEKMKLDQEELLKRLDKTIELLKRLKAEEQMQAAREKVDELLKQQNDINSSLEKDSPTKDDMRGLAEDESEVKEGLGELEKSLSGLQEALQNIDPQTASEMGKQAAQASEEGLQKDAKEASQQMEAGAQQGAMKAGGRVAKGLSSMSQKLKTALESMQQRQAQQMAKKLEHAAKDLVFLSKGQEGMVSSSDAASPQDLARSQYQIHSGAAKVADDLEEVIRGSFSLSRKLGADLGEALDKMETATGAFEAGNKRSGLATGWGAVPSLNKAAMELMQASQSMMTMASSSCSSPSGKDAAKQKMQSMCNSQRGVNESTQGLMERIESEGGRLKQSTEEQLANLAARQEMIKKGMEEVSGQLGDKNDVLGRLDQITEDMQKVMDDMENRNVDRETIRRQQRILSRMLDAQRSVRRRDMDNQRISRVGIDQPNRPSPGAVPEELLNAEDRLRSEVLQGKADPIPPAYRRLVEEYFRAISGGGR